MRVLTDFLGKEIIEGHEVVYPSRRGASMWMNYGYVEIVDTDRSRIRVRRIPRTIHERDRSVWVIELKRVVVTR